ncbi:MAG: molecular chaperone DnaJ [Rhodobacteraceae bacterium]|nr:MAG: molecular chaperone DnaJ [Paracoccaceae bacterium]
MSNDPYKALGLTKSASDAEIKKAYRKIARSCHPDLKPDDPKAEAKFKAASAAYDLLKDSETRARFDKGEIDASGAERPERQFYREYAEAPGNPYRSGQRPQDFGDASDIFSEFLRQRAGEGAQYTHGYGQQNIRARGADRRYSLEVPFLDAVKGGSTQIQLPDGAALEVKIPEGINDGQTIRLRGKGMPGIGGGPSGDGLVTLSVRDHPVFRRDGNDIVITLPITLDEAVLGAKVATPTIGGTVNLGIPKGASSGQVLRLRGRGVKAPGSKTHGDQRVELSIVSPPKIDTDLAEFMEKWRKDHAYDPRKGMKI